MRFINNHEFNKNCERNFFFSDFNKIRKSAFKKLECMGFPNRKWENWRFTNITHLENANYKTLDFDNLQNIDLSSFKIDNYNTVIIYNGQIQYKFSKLCEGLKLLSAKEYFERTGDFFSSENSPFDLLNTAFMDSALCLIVDQKTTISKPIKILYISNGDESIMTNPRLYIDVEQGSNLKIIEEHIGDAQSSLQNQAFYLTLKDNTNVEHTRIQSNSENSNSFSNLYINQDRNSKYDFNLYMDGSKLIRNEIFISLNNENSECNINLLSLSKNDQHHDNKIIINHNSHNTKSSQFVKSILTDKSSTVFNGRTIIKKNAQKVEASQSNKNLLLSESARTNSIPQLEIYADDVKCSHGSTTGQIDEDALFYLRSRGIPKQDALNIFIEGFAMELIDIINDEIVKENLLNKIKKWIL